MGADEKEDKAFDPFELMTAILLGLAAIGAAMAGLQAGQWGGRQLEAFSESNTLTTKAATQYNEDIVSVNADYAAVAAAKVHILEARDAKDPADKERHFEIASYLYSTQLTEKGYKAMELPMDFYVEDAEPNSPAAPAAPATDGARPQPAAAEEDEEEEDPAAAGAADTPKLEKDIPDEELLESLFVELDEDYIDGSLETGEKMFADADKRFADGRQANDNGDKFDLVGVYYTVALFFAGVGLVFKTNIRWGFFALSLLIFAASSGFMATLNWAG